MPVIFRQGGLRYFFFSNEGSPREAPHIHVKGGGRDAKVWLEPEPIIAKAMASIRASLRVSYALS
jgi:Domain of unknown function (DUF4160)